MKINKILIAAAVCIALSIPAAWAKSVNVNISQWSVTCQYNEKDTEEGYVAAEIIRDDPRVPDGRAALYTKCGNYKDYTYVVASQNLTGLQTGEKYRLSAKIYSSTCSYNHVFRFGGNDLVNCSQLREQGQLREGAWCDVSYEFVYTYASNTFTIMNWNLGEFILDNLSIQQILYDEEGNVSGYGEELVKNGGFEEDLDDTPCAEVSNVSVTNLDAAADLSWKNPTDSDFTECLIYDVTDGAETLLGRTSEESFHLTGLKNNCEYQIRIKTSDAWKNLSEGTVVKVAPVADAFKSHKPVFSIDGKETSSLSAGKLTVSAEYKNNRMTEDYSVELIAVLRKDGAAVDVNSAYAIIPKTEEDGAYRKLSVDLDIPQTDGYDVIVYIWDSMTGMTALDDPYILK